jgi:hypothetical protein
LNPRDNLPSHHPHEAFVVRLWLPLPVVAFEEDPLAKPSSTRHLLSTYFLFQSVIGRNQLYNGGFSSFIANIIT